jgi:hypothetical protein
MGRGHNPEISPKERIKWLEKLEDGQGITSISNDAKRDIRIVKRNIDLAREERQTSRVRHDFLLGKLEQHQQDLLDEVRRLKSLVTHFPPNQLVPEEPIQNKIYEAFLEHVKRLPLKSLLQRWEEAFLDFGHELDAVKSDLCNREKEIKLSIPEEFQTLDWPPSIIEALEQPNAQDGPLVTRLKHYEHPRVKDQNHPYWGSTRLTQNPLEKPDASLVIKAHRELVEYGSNYLPILDQWRGRFKELSEQIVDELEVFIIKRMVPSNCRYCPI